MELNEELVKRLQGPIYETWNAIGPDLMQAYEYMPGEYIDNGAAIEGCLDANRIQLFTGDVEAENIISAACVKHGYGNVIYFLSQKLQLI